MGWRRLPAFQALTIFITAAALSPAAAQQLQPPTAQSPAHAPSPAEGVRPKAIATTNAVAALASALLSIAAPENPAPVSPISNLTLPYRPGRLLVKFRDLDGANYSQIVDTVNDWAGIDLVKVNSAVLRTLSPEPHCCMPHLEHVSGFSSHPYEQLSFSCSISIIMNITRCRFCCASHASS